MKTLTSILLILSMFLTLFTANIFAADYTCNGEIVTHVDGATDDANMTYSEDSNGSNKARYFTFTPAVGGEITISYGQNAALTQEKQTLEIGTTCGGVEIYKDVSGKTSDSHTFYVSNGTTYYVKITEKNGSNALRFTTNFQFKAIKIGFENAVYSLAEDKDIPDNATQALALTVKLTHATTFDITVTYTTLEASPISAISGTDFRSLTNTVTFSAGETEKIIYVDIIHDVPIELEENFFVELSNITVDAEYNGVVGFGDNNPTEIVILEQTEAQLCFEDDFSTTLDDDWRLLYSDGGYIPAIVNGRLRMTTATNGLATAVTKDYEFAAAYNLIIIEFDHFAYDGSGADGFTLALYDSSVGASPVPGAFGGSLGYANRTGVDGFEGGWLGLGLDEYGNFSNPTEGRNGGTSFKPNAISIRGKGSGETGYAYLAGTDTLSPVLWSSNTNYSGGRFRMTIDSRDPLHLYITLERDSARDGTYESVIINKFDAIGSQGPSPDYIRLAVTASTGASNAIHEVDDLVVKGVCRGYVLSLPTFETGFVDAVDSYTDATYTDANGADIKTKISNKGSYSFDAVYLGSDNSGVETYSPTGTFDSMPLTVEITVADSTCENEQELTAEDGSPFAWAEILINTSYATTVSPVTFPSLAMSDARLKFRALDWNSLFNSYNVSNSCSVSSTHGSLCGVPSCLGSANQANEAFPPDSPENINILTDCYGLASDGSGSIGTNSPCNGTNYEGNCGGINSSKTILPSKYSNKLGCLACILDQLSQATCSEDHFAIRPEKFNLDSTGTNYPDLLRAGEDYNLTITATDYATNIPTQDYNQPSSNLSTSGLTKWENVPAVINNSLNGAASLGDFNITNGISSVNGISGEVASFSYTDVGLITLKVQDMNWSAIDSDDTAGDCSETGRYICGDRNVTLIPHHFSFVNPTITNNNANPGTFTYIANLNPADSTTFAMSARINTRIEARNKDDAITQNFKTGESFYENAISVNMSLVNATYGDANTTNIATNVLGFGLDNSDINGTRTITWNESNTSKVLRFNFPRDVNNTLNPFDINGSDLNMTILSVYTGTAPAGTASIIDDDSGKATAGGSSTMIYGRTHAPRQRYTGTTGTAFIYYESFCFATDSIGTVCNKALLPNGLNSTRTNDLRWYVNGLHSVTNDGNVITINERGTNNAVTEDVPARVINSRTEAKLDYDGTFGFPYKTTMENSASSWLIYNEHDASATKNKFSVEFDKVGGSWSGAHETNTTTGDPSTNKTNRRTMW